MVERHAGPALTLAEGTALARLAVTSIAARLAGRPQDGRPPGSAALRARGASFVTLAHDGRLLGCIGTLDVARPLYLDVLRNAGRAMRDPRLPEVTIAEWPGLDVTVSVLTTPEPATVAGRADLLELLRPGVDGLLLTAGHRRA